MPIHNMVGGGGAGLNFTVVDGTSAPTSPKENTVWVNTDTAITSWDFSATRPSRRSSNKNILVYPYDSGASLTSGGVTFTCNTSGHITVNGTATSNVFYRIYRNNPLWLDPGTYTISGCPAQPSGGNAYTLYVYDDIALRTIAGDYGSGKTFTLTERTEVSISIQVLTGKTATNAVFKPQLEKGSTATSFVKGDATGQVWFSAGADSTAPMNIDKKNTVMIYPVACKQYVGGAWVRKIAQTYLNGAWADWMLVLWDYGDNTVVSGGWGANTFHTDSTLHSSGSVTVNSDGTVTVSTGNGSATRGESYTNLILIDITPFSTMAVHVTGGQDGRYDPTACFGVTPVRTGATQWTARKAGVTMAPSAAQNQGIVTVDIASVNEPCYVLVGAAQSGGAVDSESKISFSKIELY